MAKKPKRIAPAILWLAAIGVLYFAFIGAYYFGKWTVRQGNPVKLRIEEIEK